MVYERKICMMRFNFCFFFWCRFSFFVCQTILSYALTDWPRRKRERWWHGMHANASGNIINIFRRVLIRFFSQLHLKKIFTGWLLLFVHSSIFIFSAFQYWNKFSAVAFYKMCTFRKFSIAKSTLIDDIVRYHRSSLSLFVVSCHHRKCHQ